MRGGGNDGNMMYSGGDVGPQGMYNSNNSGFSSNMNMGGDGRSPMVSLLLLLFHAPPALSCSYTHSTARTPISACPHKDSQHSQRKIVEEEAEEGGEGRRRRGEYMQQRMECIIDSACTAQ